ncbi:MAG: hypothetical protein NZ958_03610 [Bacteroidia bacterium]|nr:hypothetical protein [Bacteroidia bacterium]MDW8088305.1 hypothetical protein [Bacteroidia bacterium]
MHLRLTLILVSLWPAYSQRVVSRTQIDVKGYSIEQMGLPRSPVWAGPGRFAYIEYWAQGKPQPGYYVECLNTRYYSVWSYFIDIPARGRDYPLTLVGLKEAVVLLSYDEDPLTPGVLQEVVQFLDHRGRPLLRKWTTFSAYDRLAAKAVRGLSLSPDSTHLLWYAYLPGKKKPIEQAWFALWHQSGRKVVYATDWNVPAPILKAFPDNKGKIWLLTQATGETPTLLYYDPTTRTFRNWRLNPDSVLQAPWLYVTPTSIYVGGLIRGAKNLPLEKGLAGQWAIGRLPLPLSDTSRILWSRAAIPWTDLYKEPTGFTAVRFLPHGDKALYILWEDLREKREGYLAYDVWVTRWELGDSLQLAWSHRIEKRQRELKPEALSFYTGLSNELLTVAFLTEHTGRGKLQAHQINHQTGESLIKDIAENKTGELLVLPGRSVQLSGQEVITLALPAPGRNGYQIYHLEF